MANGSNTYQAQTLVHICDKMLTLILSLQESHNLKDVATLQTQIQAEYGEMQNTATTLGIERSNIELVSFALIAFADETIARSAWTNRTMWPFLQYAYFRTHRAGERFFGNLQKIRGNGYDPAIWRNPTTAGLLEIYYLCLLLGFQGEWEFSTPQQVQYDMGEIQQHIRAKPVGPLSPNMAPKPYDDAVRSEEARWKWAAIALYLMLIVALVLISIYWREVTR